MKPIIMHLALAAIAIMIIAMPVSALVFDNAGILDESFINKTLMFENETGANLTVVTLAQADDLGIKAEEYSNKTGSDMILLYDLKSNKIAIARPVDRPSLLDDSDIEGLLGKRYVQKQLIKTGADAAEYISDVLDDLKDLMLEKGGKRMPVQELRECSIIKDGICDTSCYNDLDCRCGNGICDYDENYLTCKEDCNMTDDYGCMYISDGYCDKNCPGIDIDCPIDYTSPEYLKAKSRVNTLEIALIAMLAVLVIILVYIYTMTRRGSRG